MRVPYLQTESALNRPGTGVVSEQAASSRSKRSFVVLERKVSVNQEIGSSLQGHLFTLASDLHRMRVKALVGEGDIDKVRRGMGVRFSVSGGGEDARKFTGTVEDIYLMPRQEHGAVSFEVLIDVRNEPISDGEDWKLRPGLTASVDIIRRTHRGVWKVPTAALNFEPRADHITPDAHAKLDRRNDLREPSQWQTVWTVDDKGKPWPLFVRTGGKGAHGETGIQDDQSTEVLEWESDVKEPASLRVITAEPPPPKPLFSVPNIKF